MVNNRDFLINNNLNRNGSEKIYVWPEGIYQLSAGDTTLLTAASNAGFVAAKGHDGRFYKQFPAQQFHFNIDHVYTRIGHTWTSAPTETANITQRSLQDSKIP